jgi:hypothetical protein
MKQFQFYLFIVVLLVALNNDSIILNLFLKGNQHTNLVSGFNLRRLEHEKSSTTSVHLNKHHSSINREAHHFQNFIVLNNSDPYFNFWNQTKLNHLDSSILPGVSVVGAAIVSDLGSDSPISGLGTYEKTLLSIKHLLNLTKENRTYDFERFSSSFSLQSFSYLMDHYDQVNRIITRIENINHLETILPFPLIKWNAVYTSSCPLFPNGHATERGLIWAHYRIWKEFVYFDQELQYQWDSTSSYHNQTLMSIDKKYLIDSKGNHYKNGILFHSYDRLVIFEDDVVSAIKHVNSTMIEELTDMGARIDIVYLGWCEGRAARPVPLCSHAYALTRAGAQQLIKYFEPCGRAADEQFVIIIKNNWLKFRKAHTWSYQKDMIREDFPCHGDKTYGIFRQCKQLYGSVNGH